MSCFDVAFLCFRGNFRLGWRGGLTVSKSLSLLIKNVFKPDSCGRPQAKVLLERLNLSNADIEGTEQQVRHHFKYDITLKASLTV